MGFMQSLALGKKMIMWLLGIPLVPIFCLIYIVTPHSKVPAAWLSTSFNTHTARHTRTHSHTHWLYVILTSTLCFAV